MECNKEEAVRAMSISEKKMQCMDFVGAQKFALKAQQLFPNLENILQMLTVCKVHCSAETKVNGCKDWYGILQVESTADEFLINKQYSKLAVLLHPDSNKFAGAEAAFKLVGEAHTMLLDQAKHSVYDMKRKATVLPVGQRSPLHQPNKSSNARKQPAVPNIYQNIATTPLATQQMQTVYTAQTFWTACPYCRVRYQYFRTIINKTLRCQNCLKPFVAFHLDSLDGSGIRQCKDSEGQCVKNISQQSNSDVSPSTNVQGNSGSVPETITRVGTKNVFGEDLGNKVKENSRLQNGIKKEHEANEKTGTEKPLESSAISAEGLNGAYERKHSQASGSQFTATEAEGNVGGSGPSACSVNEKESHLDTPGNRNNDVTKNGYGFMSKPPHSLIIPDSEFYDFEPERSMAKFHTGQIWALYCEDDGFPKYYGLVKKVDSEDSRVHVAWLEPFPLLEEVEWLDEDLPFACGRYRLCFGREANGVFGVLAFSHVVQAELVEKRWYDIYPHAYEVWAVYKNWNVQWKVSDLENCLEKGEYEVVLILSSFAYMVAVVMILEKVHGYKAVFKPRTNKGVPDTMEIPRNEFLRFSHRIPSFRLTEERGGQLCGYWELDPASLPDNLLCTKL